MTDEKTKEILAYDRGDKQFRKQKTLWGIVDEKGNKIPGIEPSSDHLVHLADPCPDCKKNTLMTDGDTIWCTNKEEKCKYEWFV
jgi:hypothetical protein